MNRRQTPLSRNIKNKITELVIISKKNVSSELETMLLVPMSRSSEIIWPTAASSSDVYLHLWVCEQHQQGTISTKHTRHRISILNKCISLDILYALYFEVLTVDAVDNTFYPIKAWWFYIVRSLHHCCCVEIIALVQPLWISASKHHCHNAIQCNRM